MSIPIWTNILVINLTIMAPDMATGFTWRIGYYLLLEALILWYYKARIIAAFQSLTAGLKPKFQFPIWAYLLLPMGTILLELLPAIPQILLQLFTHPAAFLDALKQTPHWISKLFGGS